MRKIVSYGGGVNGVAMLIAMVRSGDRPDAILFADTAGEVQATYDYKDFFSGWLQSKGFPPITTVVYRTKKKRRITLEQEVLKSKTLPSIAFGFKTCSQKHKIHPQQQWCRYHYGKEAITWYVGFDANEVRRAVDNPTKSHQNKYPLIDLGWSRERCEQEIIAEGLPLPVKSACFYCPSRKKHEILSLPVNLQRRAINIERNADLTSIKGLGRRFKWEDVINGNTADADEEHHHQVAFKNATGEDLEPINCDCI